MLGEQTTLEGFKPSISIRAALLGTYKHFLPDRMGLPNARVGDIDVAVRFRPKGSLRSRQIEIAHLYSGI
jgi:hypothetical protein